MHTNYRRSPHFYVKPKVRWKYHSNRRSLKWYRNRRARERRRDEKRCIYLGQWDQLRNNYPHQVRWDAT